MIKQKIDQLPSLSPLLEESVIERGYTKGVEYFIQGKTEPDPGPEQQKDEFADLPKDPDEKGPEVKEVFVKDETHEFSFDKEPADPGEGGIPPPPKDGTQPSGGGIPEPPEHGTMESGGFELSDTSAKAFAKVAGQFIKIYAPQIMFEGFAKVDLNNIQYHIDLGNLHGDMLDVFDKINQNTWQSLQYQDDEIKMWQEAFQAYLVYKNFEGINPETAFYLASAGLAASGYLRTRESIKINKEYLNKAIKSYNPDFFLKKEVEEEREKIEKEEPQKEK